MYFKMERKNCSLCKELKVLEEFGNSTKAREGKRSQCKYCEAEYRRKIRDSNEEFTFKKCSTCKVDKTPDKFSRNVSQKDSYCNRCKDCVKNHYVNNSSEILERNSLYRFNNAESIRKSKKDKYYSVLRHDPLYVLHVRTFGSIRGGIKSLSLSKKSKRTEEILGCTFEKFKNHIESQFLNWMCWENYGNVCEILTYNCSWDLDHIIPISQAKTEEEVYLLNHWSNFQPLCSKVNRNDKNNTVYPVTNLELKITINN